MSDEQKERAPFGVSMTKRAVSSRAEKELYRVYEIGQKGNESTIELVDYMGSDDTVERVATMGFGRDIFSEKPEQKDFIYHLAALGISVPFKSVQLKISMRVPIETALTFVYEPRASVNEYSGRYSVMINSARIPSKDEISIQLKGNEKLDIYERAEEIHKILVENRKGAYEDYQKLISIDLARELSRIGLGIDNDTQFFWKIDLLSLANIYNDRRTKSPHTKRCIEEVAELAKAVAPYTWHALTYEGSHREINLTMPSDDVIVDASLSPPAWQQKETRRVTVLTLEELLFQPKKFLNHGEFQVVDYMGDDSAFAQAARTSYGAGTKTLQDDNSLTQGLVRDLHTSPIEMCELAFEGKTPVFIDPRQAGRHRTLDNHGFMGYVPIGSQFYEVPESEMKYQDRQNRQGRGKEMEEKDKKTAQALLTKTLHMERETTVKLRNLGASEEIVRFSKGVGFYTKRWRTGDTHNLGHFLRLRLDGHAQKEIRDYATLVARAVEAHTPKAYRAIQEYVINSMHLSVKEQQLISRLIKNGVLAKVDELDNAENYTGVGFVVPIDRENPEKGKKLTREGEAFKIKMRNLLQR